MSSRFCIFLIFAWVYFCKPTPTGLALAYLWSLITSVLLFLHLLIIANSKMKHQDQTTTFWVIVLAGQFKHSLLCSYITGCGSVYCNRMLQNDLSHDAVLVRCAKQSVSVAQWGKVKRFCTMLSVSCVICNRIIVRYYILLFSFYPYFKCYRLHIPAANF